MDIYKKYFGKKLQKARKEKGLDQETFGAELGANQSNVSRWEQGIDFPTSVPLEDICQVLGKKESYFLPPDNQEVIPIQDSQIEIIKATIKSGFETHDSLSDKIPGSKHSYGDVLARLKTTGPDKIHSILRQLYPEDAKEEFVRSRPAASRPPIKAR